FDTAEIFARSLDHPWDELIIEERLYLASAEEILNVIHNQPDYLDQVMLFGHNPGMTELINLLSTSSISNLPTCGICELTYKIDSWFQVGDLPPDIELLDFPKKLKK
ncbi:MAG: histidine phosphatase family protein, partial [Chloroflexota bacterium]